MQEFLAKHIDQKIIDFLFNSNADTCGVGVIDFKESKYEFSQFQKKENKISQNAREIFYDLASLTKIFVNAYAYQISPTSFDKEDLLVLSHEGSLPSWGLLSRNNWQEQILNYSISKSETLYSDFSALRVMLNIKEKKNLSVYDMASPFWNNGIKSWLDLDISDETVQNGYVKGQPNFTFVHDPNAQNIKEKLSHAGLFGTIQGVCSSLISFNKTHDFLSNMRESIKNDSPRFVFGWDRAQDLEKTLAGSGCSDRTFGHLGFTGTSIWIDANKGLGHVILSNSTKEYWYEKEELNILRREVGSKLWKL